MGTRNNSDKFYLEKPEDKKKLIEILLIIGTLVAAFKIEDYLLIPFTIFIIFSIPYFIMIQKELNEGDKRFVNFISGIIAFTFSFPLSTFLALNLAGYLHDNAMKVSSFILIFSIYMMFSTLVIWFALKVE